MVVIITTDTCQKKERDFATLCLFVQRNRASIIKIINEAFDRKFTEEDRLEMLPNGNIMITSDFSLWYAWKSQRTPQGSPYVYLWEKQSNDFLGNTYIGDGVLFIEIGGFAVICEDRKGYEKQAIKCVIDTPGGVVDYNLPTVSTKEYRDLLMKWKS